MKEYYTVCRTKINSIGEHEVEWMTNYTDGTIEWNAQYKLIDEDRFLFKTYQHVKEMIEPKSKELEDEGWKVHAMKTGHFMTLN